MNILSNLVFIPIYIIQRARTHHREREEKECSYYYIIIIIIIIIINDNLYSAGCTKSTLRALHNEQNNCQPNVMDFNVAEALIRPACY